MQYVVAAFYHFFDFPNFVESRYPLQDLMKAQDVRGSILVTPEGFNGTVSGQREGIDAVLARLRDLGGPFTHKESFDSKHAFPRSKVRLKKETISIGEAAPRESVGQYIPPAEWNELISQDDVVVIDARNVYETRLGMFAGALDPNTQHFRQLPGYARELLQQNKQQKIATYCTGGIRCEKFTAWLKHEGYENVYHLEGGILKYLEEIPPEQSLWQGECYVFDKRVSVGHGLTPSKVNTMCYGCGNPVTPEDRKHPKHVEHERCVHCMEKA